MPEEGRGREDSIREVPFLRTEEVGVHPTQYRDRCRALDVPDKAADEDCGQSRSCRDGDLEVNEASHVLCPKRYCASADF